MADPADQLYDELIDLCDPDATPLPLDQLLALRDRAIELLAGADTWNKLGDVAQLRGDFTTSSYQLAEFCYMNALERDPLNAEAMEEIGCLHYVFDRYPEAIEWFERALSIESRPVSRDHLARCHAQSGKMGIAREILAELERDGETEQAAQLREELKLLRNDSHGPSSTSADS